VATPLVAGERPGAVFCWVGFSPLQFSVPKGEACQMAALHPRILIVATAPPPTLGGCRHSFLARRLIAVHWPAVFVVALAMVHATDSRLARAAVLHDARTTTAVGASYSGVNRSSTCKLHQTK